MCAADTEQSRHPGFDCGRHHHVVRPRTDDDDFAHAGHAGRHGRHQQRRRQRKTPRRHVAAHPRKRLDALLDRNPRHDVHVPMRGDLLERHACNVTSSLGDRVADGSIDARGRSFHFLLRDFERW